MESPEQLSLLVEGAYAGVRLDAFLSQRIEGWSRSRLQRLIADEDVLVNGAPQKPSYKVQAGDDIDVELTVLATSHFDPEEIPLNIVFEDEYLAVINKPAGMVVHPGAGIHSGTLANALAFHFGVQGGELEARSGEGRRSQIEDLKTRIGIVHRLDKDTSGLMVVAKDLQTQEALSQQFQDRVVEKSYVALVHGVTDEIRGTIERPIARDRHNRTRMTTASHGRYGLSLWQVRERFEKFTLVDVDIKTGRTHQIRVHLASINHPVVGDEIYNSGRDKTVADHDIRRAITDLGRFFLHAEKLSFTHPTTGERLSFKQPMPEELSDFLALLS